MIDVRLVREQTSMVKASLARRSADYEASVDAVLQADADWRDLVSRREAVRAEVKAISKGVGEAKRSGDEEKAASLAATSKELGAQEQSLGEQVDAKESERRDLMLRLPNLPADECPDGDGPDDNPVVHYWNAALDARDGPFSFGILEGRSDAGSALYLSEEEEEKARCAIESSFGDANRVPHWEIGQQLGILDPERATKMSGKMFGMYRGMGASLVRALTSWAIDSHSDAFEEVRPPSFVKTETMISTGHLPKFAEDAFHMERDDLWAIPTAEVPLTSMGREEILPEAELPVRMTAYTPCFRREAGSAGRDTRGLLRLHEFDKVEILAYATPSQAAELHRDLLHRAEALLRQLGISYRVIDLCAGDLGNSAARTFDLEAYSPGTGMWLEVSSVSWFSDYQARRANIRYRQGNEGGEPSSKPGIEFVHTLNGSALAWPRVWAALVETNRRPDGSVSIPECLRPYLRGQDSIAAKAAN